MKFRLNVTNILLQGIISYSKGNAEQWLSSVKHRRDGPKHGFVAIVNPFIAQRELEGVGFVQTICSTMHGWSLNKNIILVTLF